VATSEEKNDPVTILNNTYVLIVPPAFTVVQAVNFKQNFQQACQENPNMTDAILDFGQTKFMDSSGIGALVGCWKIAQKHKIKLVLRDVSAQVKTILALASLESMFTIEQRAEPVEETNPKSKTAADLPFTTHPSVKSRVKRWIDIVGSLVGLAITGILFIPIAIAIKLDSPGPIFFGQIRCSRLGSRFRMWKFRSMVTDAEQKKHLVENQASGALFKNANDPRITRIGRVLRKTSLDELPQFWNVLKGEMSLVGTRPPTPDEVDRYEILQWQRLDIKPGMTGEWQVNGRSSVTSFEDVVKLDLKYQENWSLAYDMQLIVKTILVIFNKNAGAM